jgi:ectoine hydroxylase-related dioxygenase (phytanoyl-CoA dioxygenase family)
MTPTGINSTQLHFFEQEGYLILPQAVPAALLEKLRTLFDELMFDPAYSEIRTAITLNGNQYISGVEKLCGKGNLASLELLGHPLILSVAETICGPDFFLIQDFAVIKHLGDRTPVLWHQDMHHERTGQCFTMGIYLDDAAENDGALRVVPGSHASGRNICELQHEPFIEVPMRAGDILLHDMMLAHSSEPMTERTIRRVLYFEFLSAAHVRQENIYTEALIHRRTRLQSLAIRYYRELHPDAALFNWTHPLADQFKSDTNQHQALKEIYAQEVGAKPSTYCFNF